MLTVGQGCFPFILTDRPVQLTNENGTTLLDPKKFSSGFFEEFHWSFEQIFGYFFVCVTENKNLCKGTAVRFSQTGSTGKSKRILEKFSLGPSVSIEISRQFGTMESTPSMPLPFIWNTRYLGPNTIREPSWPDLRFCWDWVPQVNATKLNFQTRSHCSQGFST